MCDLSVAIPALQFPDWSVCAYEDVPILPVRSRSRIPPNAAGLIVFLFGYYTQEYSNRNVARYAISDDYHSLLLPRLETLCVTLEKAFSGHIFVPFVDASPFDEVTAAAKAGLGEIGLNGLLLSQRYGSYCFIGEIVTTLALKSAPKSISICTRCERCYQACPSGALSQQGFCKGLCRSHITQKKGTLFPWEEEQIKAGGMVWGCDRCVDACLVNQKAQKSLVPEFYENHVPQLTQENLEEVVQKKAYSWRGQMVLKRNLSLLV